jgi:DNA-binding XRE family transcriptional regulator
MGYLHPAEIPTLESIRREDTMIRSGQEYQNALERLDQDLSVLERQRERLEELGLDGEKLARALQPMESFHEQLREEVEMYERMKRGDLGALTNLTGIGRWLIGTRIAKGLTQQELADRLGVAASQVSRDENNEYHGISVERAQRILEALGVRFEVHLTEPVTDQVDRDELVGA